MQCFNLTCGSTAELISAEKILTGEKCGLFRNLSLFSTKLNAYRPPTMGAFFIGLNRNYRSCKTCNAIWEAVEIYFTVYLKVLLINQNKLE